MSWHNWVAGLLEGLSQADEPACRFTPRCFCALPAKPVIGLLFCVAGLPARLPVVRMVSRSFAIAPEACAHGHGKTAVPAPSGVRECRPGLLAPAPYRASGALHGSDVAGVPA